MAARAVGKGQAAAVIVASTNNVPTAYNETAGSLAISGINGKINLQVINGTTGVLAISLNAGEGTSTNATDDAYAQAGGATPTVTLIKDIQISSRIYIRSTTGSALATGSVYISVW